MIEIKGVVKTEGGRATIFLPLKDGCRRCGKCVLKEGMKEMLLQVENTPGAVAGDEVEVEIPRRDPLVAALLLFGLPLLGMLLGVFTGYALAEKMGRAPDPPALALGAIFLAGAFLLVRWNERRREKKIGQKIRIVRIIRKADRQIENPPFPPFTKGGDPLNNLPL